MTRLSRLPAVLIVLLLAVQVPVALLLEPPWSLLFQVVSLVLAFVWLRAIRDQRLMASGGNGGGSVSREAIRCTANRSDGRAWVGGHLREIDGSLSFRPTWIERVLRRRSVEIPGERIVEAGSVPCMPSPFGGVAFCLEVRLADGEVELFRVWNPDEQARRVRRLAAGAGHTGTEGTDPRPSA